MYGVTHFSDGEHLVCLSVFCVSSSVFLCPGISGGKLLLKSCTVAYNLKLFFAFLMAFSSTPPHVTFLLFRDISLHTPPKSQSVSTTQRCRFQGLVGFEKRYSKWLASFQPSALHCAYQVFVKKKNQYHEHTFS